MSELVSCGSQINTDITRVREANVLLGEDGDFFFFFFPNCTAQKEKLIESSREEKDSFEKRAADPGCTCLCACAAT